MGAERDLSSFVNQFKVKKGSEHTHTSLASPSGSFYIPADGTQTFHELYVAAMQSGAALHFTEKHREVGPFVIDLDFRTTSAERAFSPSDVERFLSKYCELIFQYLDVDECDCYVMTKPGPQPKDGGGANSFKDGVHIVVPNAVSVPALQHIVRKRMITEHAASFEPFQSSNSLDDIVDEAVIDRNNWQMYGSSKPGAPAYSVTGALRFNRDATSQPLAVPASADLVSLLSIRNKYEASPLSKDDARANEVREAAKSYVRKYPLKQPVAASNPLNRRKNVCEDLKQAEELVNMLSAKRAETYYDWIRVGWCLRSIDYRLLGVWNDFSMRSPKWEDGTCETYWNRMRESGLGIGTLRMWAKQDSPDAYALMQRSDIGQLVSKSATKTHFDIAAVVHFMFKDRFVCVSIKNNRWYEFADHRWRICDSGHSLRSAMSRCVFREISAHASIWSTRASESDEESEQTRCSALAKALNDIAMQLKKSAFKDNIMKECREMFYDSHFEEKLDNNCVLIGFENGVYDLEVMEFREGRSEDMVSLSTHVNYVPFNPTDRIAVEIDNFMAKVLVNPAIRKYVMLLLSSFLNGAIKHEKFHIWTGSGSNGKSKTIDLFEQSFGDYCCKLPITLLTQKRAASNAATSEVARTKGKRFACLQEPSEDEKLNVGLMKELTGGDKIQARQLYREPIEFKPQFKMILTCNTLPNVPSDDGGTWRRIRVVEFTSKFCENPSKENEFEIDHALSEKFEDWKEMFISMLIEYHKEYMAKGITEPAEVMKCTNNYQKNNDTFMEFIEQTLDRKEGSSASTVEYRELLGAYKYWTRENNIPASSIRKSEFVNLASKHMGPPTVTRSETLWSGWGFQAQGGDGGI